MRVARGPQKAHLRLPRAGEADCANDHQLEEDWLLTTRQGTIRFFSSMIAIGIAAVAAMLATGPAAAQTAAPFAQTVNGTGCDNTPPTVGCTVVFSNVGAKHRWDVTHVTCRSVLVPTGAEDAQESVELNVINPPSTVVHRYFLIPVKISNANFVVSEEIFAPIAAGRHAEIQVSVFQGQFTGGLPPTCTISGQNVTLP